MKTLEVSVKGKVQGVWFRKYTADKAQSLKVRGTVENLSDGSVLVYVQGTTEILKQFIEWLHIGSPESKVEQVVCKELEHEVYKTFEIKR